MRITNLEKLNNSLETSETAEEMAVRMILVQFADDHGAGGLLDSDLDRYIKKYHTRKTWLEETVEQEK